MDVSSRPETFKHLHDKSTTLNALRIQFDPSRTQYKTANNPRVQEIKLIVGKKKRRIWSSPSLF